MKTALQKVRNAAYKAGKAESKKSLLPSVKKWMKRNKIITIYFINGRGFVDFATKGFADSEDAFHGVWPSEFKNVKVANEFIDLCNAVGYENGFELPNTIKL